MEQLLFTEEFGRILVPKLWRPKLRTYLVKAGIYREPYTLLGGLFYLSYIITILLYFLFFYGTITEAGPLWWVFLRALLVFFILPLALMGLFLLLCYFALDLRIYNRTRKMEAVLPDFLQLVSSNLKGGLSFEKSLWLAIKPRFGILSNEIAIAAKRVMTGEDVDVALKEFSDKYDSPMLKRTMDLIIGEIQSGGKVADIIDDAVENLKKLKMLKDEMTASVLAYVIFIGAIVIFIAPILFALAYNLLIVIQKVTVLLATASASSGVTNPFLAGFKALQIDKDDFILFSQTALGIIALFSSMIISIIEKGTIKAGVKYIPLFLVASQVFYYVCLKLLTAMFKYIITF